MKTEARLPIDVEPYVNQARQMRGEYIARIVRSALDGLSRTKQKTARPATFQPKSRDLCSQA